MRRLILVVAALLAACSDSPTGPGPVPPPVVAPVPPPAPAATPSAPPPGPAAPGGFAVSWSAGACFSVTNNGHATAALTAQWNSFEDQNTHYGQKRTDYLPVGESWGDCYNLACVEVDIDQPGVKPLGGYWFDVNMQPFDANREPGKVDACRAPKVVPTPQPTPSPSPTPCPEDSPTPCPRPTPTPCPEG